MPKPILIGSAAWAMNAPAAPSTINKTVPIAAARRTGCLQGCLIASSPSALLASAHR
jgi:hypothetical protein